MPFQLARGTHLEFFGDYLELGGRHKAEGFRNLAQVHHSQVCRLLNQEEGGQVIQQGRYSIEIFIATDDAKKGPAVIDVLEPVIELLDLRWLHLIIGKSEFSRVTYKLLNQVRIHLSQIEIPDAIKYVAQILNIKAL